MRTSRGRILVVAGSDSGGGAGIQADLKTVTALGGYAATAISALTAQNTVGVQSIVGVSPEFVAQQMESVLSDIGADCIKTGMLHNSEVIKAVMDTYERLAPDTPLVVDPVMVAKSGDALLEPEASQVFKARLILRATVLTPNVPEAEFLTGMTIASPGEMAEAAAMLVTLGPRAILLKGAHLDHPTVHDVLVSEDGIETFKSPRIDTVHTHGTGCTLASAIATGIAQGLGVREAVVRARDYVHTAIATAPGLGRGQGPLNHGHTAPPFAARPLAATGTAG